MIFVGTDEKNDFRELWQQHKLLKTMEMSGFSLILTMRHIHINSSLNPLTKFTSSSRGTEIYPPMERLSNNHEDHPNQLRNSHKSCDEVRHPVLSLLESQWKLRQQLDQNFPLEGKPNTSVRRKKEIQKSRAVRVTVICCNKTLLCMTWH